MLRYKKIDRRNLKTHINLTVGHLYSRPVAKKKEPKQDYSLIAEPSYTEIFEALEKRQIEVIWSEGPVRKYINLED